MEDSDFVCPICCEELDISDREFYPCKCGYQVCMWCWHRIRETESGLCPACRTPYGEDPHQFSAVDVEEVLKANKEKEAAAKRERQRSQLDEDSDPNAMEVPKDRNQLANMRVIRRNLVYAVGLPPNVATEEILRKPEYFGQYGKIAKIVLNRSQVNNVSDPRRASASAYVTFAHKEDTLACILALDGFYLDGRNIRASYGTSKYCSAFIKNVRCNNPECTYLHEMGAAEDTFTKQEIQAGYVTSGRDVLARQQQIVQEQLRQGATGAPPRKKIGGGGPSGTGKAAVNPVFPIPEYDEPMKPASQLVPAPAGVTRASTSTLSLNPANISAKLGRSHSVGTGGRSPTLTSSTSPFPTNRKTSQTESLSGPATTAASIVASGRASKVEQNDGHTMLTPLTPLKRTSKAAQRGSSTGNSPTNNTDKLTPLRNGAKKNGVRSISGAPAMPTNQTGLEDDTPGDSIALPSLKPSLSSSLTGFGVDPVGPPMDALGGRPISLVSTNTGSGGLSGTLGGEVFTGELPRAQKNTIGSLSDKWNSGGGVPLGNDPVLGGLSLWKDDVTSSDIGGSVIGGSRVSGVGGDGTSTLASLLGIDLPTGSGSLRESSYLWSGPGSAVPVSNTPSPLSALNSGALQTQEAPGTRSVSSGVGGSSLIGGAEIGGALVGAPGGAAIGGGNKSDIALLQSLLPGVHITSGGDSVQQWEGGLNRNWTVSNQNLANGLGPVGLNGDVIGGGWSNGPSSSGSSVGAIGEGGMQQNQRRGPGIW